MLGYVGEQWHDLLLTRNLIREEAPDEIGVSVAYPLPGTKFYEVVSEQLNAKRNWLDTDELAMMFQGTYATDFYHHVRDLLHQEVEEDQITLPHRLRLDGEWADLARAEAEWQVEGAVNVP